MADFQLEACSSIYPRHHPIHLLDKVKLPVLKIIQRHILPVEEHGLDIKVSEDLELLLSQASAEAFPRMQQLPGKTIGRFISPEHHVTGTGIEFQLIILLDVPDKGVRLIDIERGGINDLFSIELRAGKIDIVPGGHTDHQ